MSPDPKACGVIIAGTHPVAVDCAAATLMGFDWQKLRLLKNSFQIRELNFVPFRPDRKSTRLNSSLLVISYAVFCLKKKTPPRLAVSFVWLSPLIVPSVSTFTVLPFWSLIDCRNPEKS